MAQDPPLPSAWEHRPVRGDVSHRAEQIFRTEVGLGQETGGTATDGIEDVAASRRPAQHQYRHVMHLLDDRQAVGDRLETRQDDVALTTSSDADRLVRLPGSTHDDILGFRLQDHLEPASEDLRAIGNETSPRPSTTVVETGVPGSR